MSVTPDFCPLDCPNFDKPYCRLNTPEGIHLQPLGHVGFPTDFKGLLFVRHKDCPLAQPELSNRPDANAPRTES
jgi:hypothetical protein